MGAGVRFEIDYHFFEGVEGLVFQIDVRRRDFEPSRAVGIGVLHIPAHGVGVAAGIGVIRVHEDQISFGDGSVAHGDGVVEGQVDVVFVGGGLVRRKDCGCFRGGRFGSLRPRALPLSARNGVFGVIRVRGRFRGLGAVRRFCGTSGLPGFGRAVEGGRGTALRHVDDLAVRKGRIFLIPSRPLDRPDGNTQNDRREEQKTDKSPV